MAASEFVHLSAGYIIPTAALRLAWSLEDAGFTFKVADDGGLLVAPFDQLTPDQLVSLRQWKRHICALVHYCDQEQRRASVSISHPNRAIVQPRGAEDGFPHQRLTN